VVVAPDREVMVREPNAMLDALALQLPVSAKAGGAHIWMNRMQIQQTRVANRRGLTRVLGRCIDRRAGRVSGNTRMPESKIYRQARISKGPFAEVEGPVRRAGLMANLPSSTKGGAS
jgi:hypothetical protein